MSDFNANGGWYCTAREPWARSGGFKIAEVGPYIISDKAADQAEWNHLANARLIAAAPSMLKALKLIAEGCEINGDGPTLEIANMAIWEAEGETQ